MDRIHIEKEIEEIRTPELFLAYHPNSHVFSRHYYVTQEELQQRTCKLHFHPGEIICMSRFTERILTFFIKSSMIVIRVFYMLYAEAGYTTPTHPVSGFLYVQNHNSFLYHHSKFSPNNFTFHLFFFSSFTLIIGLLRKKKGAKNMCKKSKKMVGGVLLCIGFLIVAGAVGGIDGDTIDLLPGALQIMIGFILSGVGIEYGKLFNPSVMEIENLQEDTNETENI